MIKSSRNEFKLISVDTLAYLLILVFVFIFITLSINRHNALRSFQNDLGAYSQVTWNNLHGHFFESSGSMVAATLKPDGTTDEQHNMLAGHFGPILLLFAPLYALWPDPKIFLILQAIAVGVGALPVYWFAKEKIKAKGGGLIFLISYLFYPILHNALLYDFHEVTFGVPIVTLALWFWHKKKTGWLLFFLALLMLVQEITSLLVFMFGLYLTIFQKRWKLGLILAAISLAYFLAVVLLVIPSFSATGESALIRSEMTGNRFAWLGSSMSEIVSNLVHKPFWILKNILSAKRIDFLVTILLPLFGLPLFSSLLLLSLPVLAIYFLSAYWLTYSIYFYHSSILTGIFYFAAILAFSRLFRELKWQKIFLTLILLSSITVSYIYSVTPFGKNYIMKEYQPSSNARLLKEVEKLVPAEAALSVQHNLGPHFTNRRKLFHFPFNINKVDFVVVDAYNPFAVNPKSFYSLRDVTEIDYKLWKLAIEKLFNSQEFGVIYSQDGWLVFKRGASSELNIKALKDYLTAQERLESGLTQKDLQ